MLFSDLSVVTTKDLSQKFLQSTVYIDPEGKVNTCIMINILLLICQPIPSFLLSYGKELHDPLLELLINDVSFELGVIERLFIDLIRLHVSYWPK